MKKIVLKLLSKFRVFHLLIILAYNPVYAQIDLTKYFDESTVNFLDIDDHLKPDFQWNMSGNLQVLLNEGINYLDEDNFDLALHNFKEALSVDSTLWIGLYYSGICLKKQRKFSDAEYYFQRALRINPKLAEAYVELGEIYIVQRNAAKANKAYAKAIDLSPRLVHAYYNLGNLDLLMGEQRKAIKNFERCTELDPNFPDAYVKLGLIKFRVKRSDNESITYFNKAVEADSSHSDAYFWRGLAYLSLNNNQKCLDDWSHVIQLNPTNTFFILMRSFLYIELNQFDKAFVDLRKAIRSREIDENKFDGEQTIMDKQIDFYAAANYLIAEGYGLQEPTFNLLKKGYCLLISGKKEDALANFEDAVKTETSAVCFYLKGMVLEHLGRHNDAFDEYHKALQLDEDIFDAHKKMSVYRMELEDWRGVDAHLNSMFQLQPGSPVAYRLRGFARSHQKDYSGAIRDLSEYIKTDSTDQESLRTRSVCYASINNKHDANQDLVRILKLNPGDQMLRKDIVINYLNLNDTASALSIINEVIEPNSSYHSLLAEIYVKQKKWDLAAASAKVALSKPLWPSEATNLYLWLGIAEFNRSNFSEAIAQFNQVLHYDKKNPEAKYFRALSYEKLGNHKKALVDFKDLMVLKYKDSEIRYSQLSKKG